MNKCVRVCVAIIALAGLVWFIGHAAYEHRSIVTYLYTGDCISQLNFIDEAMYYLVTGDCINDSYRSRFETDDREPPFEIRPEHTVSDLVREALRRGLLEGKDVCDMRGDRQPYLVFPVPRPGCGTIFSWKRACASRRRTCRRKSRSSWTVRAPTWKARN